ncbi:MAG: LytTR family DNA-binding domain-containing protein [Pseudomonadota bacterium]|uniref:LytR/AlgR family response regulator transcription factor n=1 Tax=Phenylobacterium sp. TaxID=1871053 RepID=UPI002720D75A|nr:LytTR family DNA-binding domain-containing protein [Phenylobacterium sp.]MDO9433666.1 LytTR family DNA-binding domain-containing protein [Phenylobacterium sp.]
MRVLLVDDEPAALERLKALLAQIGDVTIIGAVTDGPAGLAAISQEKPDVVLLDIQMPELNGLSVAAQIPPAHRPEIVFVTAFEMYAPDAFEVEAADYLLKPVRFDRLRQAIERARRRRMLQNQLNLATPADNEDGDGIWVQTRHGHVRVLLQEIDWIEAAGDYVLLHTATRSHMHRATMSALERKLDGGRLMRVHRSAFVAPDRVCEVRRTGRGLSSLVLKDGVALQVGPTYHPAVMERLGFQETD